MYLLSCLKLTRYCAPWHRRLESEWHGQQNHKCTSEENRKCTSEANHKCTSERSPPLGLVTVAPKFCQKAVGNSDVLHSPARVLAQKMAKTYEEIRPKPHTLPFLLGLFWLWSAFLSGTSTLCVSNLFILRFKPFCMKRTWAS